MIPARGSGMDIQNILNQVDTLFEENKGEEAEKLLQKSVAQAVEEQDDNSILQLLNELIGYYRETSQTKNSFQMAAQAIAQAKRMGLEGTVPYATTLLNAANAYRAGGRLQESLEAYSEVQEIYDRQLPKDHLFVAGLQNNISLLYQEKKEYRKAKECLLKALAIVEAKDAFYEVGVTCANLASTCVELGELDEAWRYASASMLRRWRRWERVIMRRRSMKRPRTVIATPWIWWKRALVKTKHITA